MTEPTLNYVSCPDAPSRWPPHGLLGVGRPGQPHVVVCVHGLSRQGRDFDVLAQALVARAARASAARGLPGRGGARPQRLAEGPHGLPVPGLRRRHAGPAGAVAPAMRRHTLDWVGTSMGGLIGMAVRARPACRCRCRCAAGAQRRRPGHPVAGAAAHWPVPGPARRFDSVQQAARCDVGGVHQLWPAHPAAVAGPVAAHGAPLPDGG
jgi:hypothetical protein